MGKTIYCGIDQSLTGTGIAVINEKSEVLLLTTLKQKKTPHTVEEEIVRLQTILKEILSVIKEYKPDFVGMEDYGFMTKGRAFKLGEIGGIIKLALYERGLCPEVYKATTLKKFLTGKGNAEKSLMLMYIFKKYGIECSNDNEADALNIAHYLKKQKEAKE